MRGSRKQKMAQFRNGTIWRLTSVQSNLQNILSNLPEDKGLTEEEKTTLLQIKYNLSIICGKWRINTNILINTISD